MQLKDVKGIGPKSLSLLNKININSVEDLVTHYPFRYEILERCNLAEIEDGGKIIIDGKIEKNNNVIIGIYDKSFTKNNMYSAILGLDILEGGKTNECIADIKI